MMENKRKKLSSRISLSKIYDPNYIKIKYSLKGIRWLILAFIIITFHVFKGHPFFKLDIVKIVELFYLVYTVTISVLSKRASDSLILRFSKLIFDFLLVTLFDILSLSIFGNHSWIYVLYIVPIIYCSFIFTLTISIVFVSIVSVTHSLLTFFILNLEAEFNTATEVLNVLGPIVVIYYLVAFGVLFSKEKILKSQQKIDEEVSLRKAIQREKEYSQSLLKSSFDGIIAIDEKGIVKETNKHARDLLGYTKEEILEQHVGGLYAPGEATKIINLLRQSKDGTIENTKTFMMGRNKEKIPILLSASFLYDRDLHLNEELAKEKKFSSLGYFRDIRAEEIFNKISKEAKHITNEKQLLDKVAKIIAKTVKSERCCILTYHQKSSLLEVTSSFEVQKRSKSKKRIESYYENEGMTGKVFFSGKTLNISNIDVTKKEPKGIDIVWEYAERFSKHSRFGDFKHFLGTPLIIQGEVYGVIRLLNKYLSENELDKIGFTDKDQWLLERISLQVSNLLEKVLNKEKFEAFSNVGMELNAKLDLSLDELLQYIAKQIVIGMKFKACYLRLIEESKKLKIKACYGIDKQHIGNEEYTIKIGEGVSGKVAQTGNIQIIKNLKENEEYIFKKLLEPEKLASLLSIPLKYRGRIIGVINCYTSRTHRFTEQEIQIMKTFAVYAAVAIQNKKRVDELMALNEIGRELLRPYQPDKLKQFEIEDLLDIILKKAKAISGADRLCIKKYNDQTNELTILRSLDCVWDSQIKNYKAKLGDDIVSKVIKTGNPSIIPHYDINLEKLMKVPAKKLLKEIKSRIVMPIKIYGKAYGVLCLESYRVNFFTEDDFLILRAFSIQAAIAIRNANYLKKLKAVSETFPSISELNIDMDEVLKKIANKAAEALEVDLLILYRYDEKHKKIISPPIFAGEMYFPQFMKAEVGSFRAPLELINKGKSRYAVKSQKDPIMTPPKHEEEQEAPERFVVREKIVSSAGVILKVSQEIVGVMFINYRMSHEFNADERQLIEIFSSYIAIAIQNVMHFSEKKVADVMRTIGTIASSFAHKIKNDIATITLYTGSMLDEIKPGHSLYFPLDKIKEKTSKITIDIDHLQKASKLYIKERKPINMNNFINELKNEIAINPKMENIDFDIDIPPNIPRIKIDPIQMKLVFINLAQNSIEAMPEGGKISISISKAKEDILIKWADTGPGISPEDVQKIYDVFWTTKDKGYGLGLFHAKRIIEEHGGAISLDLNYTKGARFLIKIPK